MLERD